MQSEEDGRRGLGWDEKEGARWSAPTSGIEARAGSGWDHQAATARPLAVCELAGVSAYARGLLRTQVMVMVMARPWPRSAGFSDGALSIAAAVVNGGPVADSVLCRPLRGPACSTYHCTGYCCCCAAATHRRATTHCLKPRLSR
jgi:hypothetical protein